MFGLRSVLINSAQKVFQQQTRNTFILKRRTPPNLHKKGTKTVKLRSRHFVYDLVQDTNLVKQPNVTIILKEFVDGVGYAGDIISVRPNKAYNEFLLPGLAVYATPENKDKYKIEESKLKPESSMSSPYAKRTMGCLSRHMLELIMSKTEPWTVEKWHVRASFRKAGFVVPEHAIELPPVEIKGPDLSLQDKEFLITVTINNKEKVHVRTRIHHWAIGLERLPWVEYHWKKPCEPLIPEQAPILENMPLPK